MHIINRSGNFHTFRSSARPSAYGNPQDPPFSTSPCNPTLPTSGSLAEALPVGQTRERRLLDSRSLVILTTSKAYDGCHIDERISSGRGGLCRACWAIRETWSNHAVKYLPQRRCPFRSMNPRKPQRVLVGNRSIVPVLRRDGPRLAISCVSSAKFAQDETASKACLGSFDDTIRVDWKEGSSRAGCPVYQR
jgi:hypothetical protein